MNNSKKTGFIQLINERTNEVVSQRKGTAEDVEHHKNKVWFVKPGLKVQFSESSDVAHPPKFFRPIPKETIVNIYLNELDIDKTKHLTPSWSGKAEEVENLFTGKSIDLHEFTATDTSHNWLGTSEF